MSKKLEELNDKIDELDAATDELWDIKDQHGKKIEELDKDLSGSVSDLMDEIRAFENHPEKLNFHEQKIEALLRRVKNHDIGTKKNKMISNKQINIIAGAFIISAFIYAYSNRYKPLNSKVPTIVDTWTGCFKYLGDSTGTWICSD